ncbi:MAG: hypothetical protein ABIQ95_00620 [Bdellovibrionia bacterium]
MDQPNERDGPVRSAAAAAIARQAAARASDANIAADLAASHAIAARIAVNPRSTQISHHPDPGGALTATIDDEVREKPLWELRRDNMMNRIDPAIEYYHVVTKKGLPRGRGDRQQGFLHEILAAGAAINSVATATKEVSGILSTFVNWCSNQIYEGKYSYSATKKVAEEIDNICQGIHFFNTNTEAKEHEAGIYWLNRPANEKKRWDKVIKYFVKGRKNPNQGFREFLIQFSLTKDFNNIEFLIPYIFMDIEKIKSSPKYNKDQKP